MLVILEHPTADSIDVKMRFFNADGTKGGLCGNATRCVGHLIMREKNKQDVFIETESGQILHVAQSEKRLSHLKFVVAFLPFLQLAV